jgi:hypothetical protein
MAGLWQVLGQGDLHLPTAQGAQPTRRIDTIRARQTFALLQLALADSLLIGPFSSQAGGPQVNSLRRLRADTIGRLYSSKDRA